MTHYIEAIDGKERVWGVVIPDFPGCHGGGETPTDAVEDAIRAGSPSPAHAGCSQR